MRFTMLILLLLVVFTPGWAFAQQATQASTGDQSTPAKKTIGIRLTEWKTAHFNDEEQAEKAEQTFAQIGCEVERLEHNGHTDVRYRCPSWKRLTVNTDEQVAQWTRWLEHHGMLTMIIDPATGVKCSRVEYQLASTRTVRVGDEAEAETTRNVMELMGCSVEVKHREGQIDLEYSCPEWKTAGFANCGTAHAWQDWLRQQGFVTRHSH